jgi:hypothetical protein
LNRFLANFSRERAPRLCVVVLAGELAAIAQTTAGWIIDAFAAAAYTEVAQANCSPQLKLYRAAQSKSRLLMLSQISLSAGDARLFSREIVLTCA